MARYLEKKNINLLLLGAPNDLDKSSKIILNIELLLFNYFLFKEKLSNKIPLLINLKSFCDWYRDLFLKSGYYKKSWEDWSNPSRNS